VDSVAIPASQHYLDAVVSVVEELAAAQGVEHLVVVVVHHVVCADGGQGVTLGREDAALQSHHVILLQNVVSIGQTTSVIKLFKKI
jgi:hypothetical protein